ncbi:MAG: hypothetical protein KG012_17905 [Deltaproteobacteria bacterium]|jgi:antitoxin (DNA-binding transcriptional repressor) of toxin-antitoxin stability system|nr:hypothetical protein [Deltaproteobacteria bacterium]
MEKKINATEAVRRFSEILNDIKYRGESYTIVRRGKRAASIYPVEVPLKGRSLGELRTLLINTPMLGMKLRNLEEI